MPYAATAVLLAVFALAAGLLAGAVFAVPIGILAVVLLGFVALSDLSARRVLERHGGDVQAVAGDETESGPAAVAVPDGTALGDTAQAHAALSPHDVPKDSPIRAAVEQQAARHPSGTTRGNGNGAAGGRLLKHDHAPPSSDEPYDGDRPDRGRREG